MWIVEVALKRPYTFIVLALLLPLLGALTVFGTPLRPGMPVDIFPDIAIPVIAVNFNYTGMSPDDISGRITAQIERYATTIVNDIEHVESQNYPGIAVIKLFFQPGVNIDLAMSQVTAYGQTALKQMPPGVVPPLVLKYNASSVPILQLAMSSDKLTEAQLFDFGNQVIRSQIATIAGVSIPYPFGGATRQVQIDLRPEALRAQSLTPVDVNTAITNQSLIIPAGTQKIGDTEYNVRLNGSTPTIDAINDLPIRSRDGSVTYIRDVAFVHDGHPPQTNVVRVNGRRAVLMSIQKTGSASTLNIVNSITDRLPRVRELLPEGASIAATGDQSVFVRAAIRGVVTEALIAAALTALMVLLFLGSWRSTLIIAISIPLSILSSIILLGALGETINLMTLGGLALAVGILVGRCHGDHREHQSPSRGRHGGNAGHPRRLAADRGPGAGLDPVHLYRIRTDVPAHGRRALPVRAPGRSRRVRNADLVPAVTDPGADPVHVLAAHRRRGKSGAGEAECVAAFPAPVLRRASRRCVRATMSC